MLWTITLPVEWCLHLLLGVVHSPGHYVSCSPGWLHCWLLHGVRRAVCMLCLLSRPAQLLAGRMLAAAGLYCHNSLTHSEFWVICKESIYSRLIACCLTRSLSLYPPRTSSLAPRILPNPSIQINFLVGGEGKILSWSKLTETHSCGSIWPRGPKIEAEDWRQHGCGFGKGQLVLSHQLVFIGEHRKLLKFLVTKGTHPIVLYDVGQLLLVSRLESMSLAMSVTWMHVYLTLPYFRSRQAVTGWNETPHRQHKQHQ